MAFIFNKAEPPKGPWAQFLIVNSLKRPTCRAMSTRCQKSHNGGWTAQLKHWPFRMCVGCYMHVQKVGLQLCGCNCHLIFSWRCHWPTAKGKDPVWVLSQSNYLLFPLQLFLIKNTKLHGSVTLSYNVVCLVLHNQQLQPASFISYIYLMVQHICAQLPWRILPVWWI